MKVDVRTSSLGALEERLRVFEADYGVPSSEMATAFTADGVLKETSEFRRWSFLYGSWLAARRALEARSA
jgi:hypothetical protein